MTVSSHSSTRTLAAAFRRQTITTGASTPAVRGSDWHRAVVATVGNDGTITTTDGIVALRAEPYQAPQAGDVIRISISSTGSTVAEGRLATGDAAVGQALTAYKTSSTSRASNTTASPDPDLSVTVAAGAVYTIDGLIVTSNAGLAGDLKCAVIAPAGTAGRWTMIMPSTTSSADPDAVRVATNTLGTTLAYGHPTTGMVGGQLKGLVVVGATAGQVAFSWAQQTSNATATLVETYSWLRLTRIA